MEKHAILVGVSRYEKADIADLQFSANDAARLADVLIRNAGFKSENTQLFHDGPPKESRLKVQLPTYPDIISAFSRLAERAASDDVLLFFFAGHGVEVSESPYLLTNDTRLNVIKDTALAVERLNDILRESKAGFKLKFFDACRAAVGQRTLTARAMSQRFQSALLLTPKGTATLSACSSGEYAYEHPDFQQGLFSYYLCEGLSGLAARTTDRTITLDGLVDYIRQSVANETKSRGLQQTPQ